MSGDQLLAQGYRRSGGVLNLGYRRKLTDRFGLMLTAQNVLDSAKQVTFIETPACATGSNSAVLGGFSCSE